MSDSITIFLRYGRSSGDEKGMHEWRYDAALPERLEMTLPEAALFLRHDSELIESGVLGQEELAGGCLIY